MTENSDEQILEAVGRCRVVVRDGKVTKVGEARITMCPLTKKFAYPISALDKESVKANIEYRIKMWGMCTPRREVSDTRPFVGFGASELLSFGLLAGMFDAIVLACDGAGDRHRNQARARAGYRRQDVRPMAGVAEAYRRGYKNVAVTVAIPAEAKKIRQSNDQVLFKTTKLPALSGQQPEPLV